MGAKIEIKVNEGNKITVYEMDFTKTQETIHSVSEKIGAVLKTITPKVTKKTYREEK